ncbi:sensor histidine kinase [Mucilaginibacter terrae]|uniref:histidine kinase n=1 Tax=Mucilaginibacter terrae TaxID=1955052 RepID=A0ABU3GXX0_9SPHI|nr:sensor histidine kinase [Mucilaginibacter terrae]MDT3404604.1 signal transduction histidine kinase [Mucilaginibacter terrae]
MNPIDDREIELLIVSALLFFCCLVAFIIYFIILYKDRQNKHKQEQEFLQSKFKQELLKAQLEIQEQTLTTISREIHDNIGQVLSFVKLNLGSGLTGGVEVMQQKMTESRELVAQAINDLRDLSKSLSFHHIMHLGLAKSIEIAAEQINKSGLLNINVNIDGEPYSLGEQSELVLFRIFQESLNNALKYAEASHFDIDLQFTTQIFKLTLIDDGRGFSVEERMLEGSGAGLKNIENRASLIGATASIQSAPGKGCTIIVLLDHTLQSHANGDHPNSIS